MLKRVIKKVYSIIFIILHEKKYKRHKFLYKKSRKSNKLLIVFSAFPSHYCKGGYNYIWSLRKARENIIWLRDRFGAYDSGTYYLGTNYPEERTFIYEINEIINKYSLNRTTYYLGTSKGGTAALMYGIKNNGDYIIAGSPQLYIGDYLNENDYHRELLFGISKRKDAIDILNNVLVKIINEKNMFNGKIFLLISSKEESFSHHIEPLISILSKYNNLNYTDRLFCNHNDVGLFFADYAKKIIKEN